MVEGEVVRAAAVDAAVPVAPVDALSLLWADAEAGALRTVATAPPAMAARAFVSRQVELPHPFARDADPASGLYASAADSTHERYNIAAGEACWEAGFDGYAGRASLSTPPRHPRTGDAGIALSRHFVDEALIRSNEGI